MKKVQRFMAMAIMISMVTVIGLIPSGMRRVVKTEVSESGITCILYSDNTLEMEYPGGVKSDIVLDCVYLGKTTSGKIVVINHYGQAYRLP